MPKQPPFQPGDVVRCTDGTLLQCLCASKEYTVEECTDRRVELQEAYGGFQPSRFELVHQPNPQAEAEALRQLLAIADRIASHDDPEFINSFDWAEFQEAVVRAKKGGEG